MGRELKKFGKKVQVEVQQKRQKEKREMMEDVKKFKKGQTDNLDFLEKRNNKKGEDRVSAKRQAKDKKFGFGGKREARNTTRKKAPAMSPNTDLSRREEGRRGPREEDDLVATNLVETNVLGSRNDKKLRIKRKEEDKKN